MACFLGVSEAKAHFAVMSEENLEKMYSLSKVFNALTSPEKSAILEREDIVQTLYEPL